MSTPSSLPMPYYLLGGVVTLVGWYLVPYLYDPYKLRRSAIPGPKLAAFSNLWLGYVSAKGHRSTSVHELHQRYGKLVRIAPDHVSIADNKAVEILYAHGSNGSLKSDFYDAFVSINDALFSTRNRAAHARKRRLVSAAFSLQNVLHFEPHVRRHIRLFFAQWDLRAAKAVKGTVEGARDGWSFFNVPSHFNYLAFDIIGDLAFGKPFGMIPNQSDVVPMIDHTPENLALGDKAKVRYVSAISVLNGRGNYSASVGVLPAWLREWVRVMPWFAKGNEDVQSLAGMASAAVDRRLRFGVPEEEPLDDEEELVNGGKRTDLLEKLIQGKDERGEPMGRDELTAEALTQMIAGSDTTSNSSFAITFHLAANPEVQRKLQAELDAAMPHVRSAHPRTDIKHPTSPPLPPAGSVAKWADIKALPYLQAVINEGMRLHSTFGLGPPRIVPRGGLEICGERFEEGTILSVPSYSLHHNRELWGHDYESFKPERWFGREPGKEYNPFSFGPRACVGRNLAMLEMTIIIASIFHRYEFVLDYPGQKVPEPRKNATTSPVNLSRLALSHNRDHVISHHHPKQRAHRNAHSGGDPEGEEEGNKASRTTYRAGTNIIGATVGAVGSLALHKPNEPSKTIKEKYGRDPNSRRAPLPPADASNTHDRDNISTKSYASGADLEFPEHLSRDSPSHAPLPQAFAEPASSTGLNGISTNPAVLDPGFMSTLDSRSHSPSMPWYHEFTGCILSDSRSPAPTSPLAQSRPTTTHSNEAQPIFVSGDPLLDVFLFGPGLASLRISGISKSFEFSHGNDGGGNENDDGDDGGDGEGRNNEPAGGGGGGDDPNNPDDPDGAQVLDPPIQIPPSDPAGILGEPGGDNAPLEIPALNEHPTLLNIYLRVWILYAFYGATQNVIQAVLESHQFALLACGDFYPPDFLAEISNMPTTLRSLEHHLGMDFSDLITTYPVCPEVDCGKRYTMEQLYTLHDPQCLRHAHAERCPGILYAESVLADGTRKRTPVKSFPYNSLPRALGHLLSRIGMANLMQHWRRDNNPNDQPLQHPPEPQNPQEWFENMDPNRRFGDMSRAWGWSAQATGLRRRFEDGEYGDEPTGDAPLSLARYPLGLSIGVNMDGFGAFKGKFAAGGSYSVNGVYIIINNLPPYQRNLIENMVLAMVIPGPHEPKGYAFEQMLEPLIDDLVALANGVELPVYNSETGQIEQRLVYANLSVLIVDWIARLKCTGPVGIAAEENHCPYCKIRQCMLGVPEGYQPDGYDLRDPHEHLQDKHRWLRAPEHDREAIRQETGTSFTEFNCIPGFFAFANAPIDAMHLLDLGVTATIARSIVFGQGMLRRRFPRQDPDDTPEARFNAFLARTVFPHHCSRIPTTTERMNSCTKAEQWRLLRIVMPVAYFEAWRVGDAIPENDIPPGPQNSNHYKSRKKSAKALLKRRWRVHAIWVADPDHDDPGPRPQRRDCFSSRNPRDYYANIMRYCVGSTELLQQRSFTNQWPESRGHEKVVRVKGRAGRGRSTLDWGWDSSRE